MKQVLISAALVIGAGLAGYGLSPRGDATLASANDQKVQQLLAEIERGSLRRLEDEKRIDELTRTLSELRSQVAAANSKLALAEQQVNPEYEVIERQIRRDVLREIQSQPTPRTPLTKAELVRNLNDLDPVEVGEIMGLQSQYGSFLQALDVGDARMEVIVDGLSTLVADQNQARMELMQELRQQDVPPQDLRSRMQAINSPEAQREALSFLLTEQELAVFDETLAAQPQPQRISTFISAPTSERSPGLGVVDGPVFFGTREITSPDGSTSVRIITSEPQ